MTYNAEHNAEHPDPRPGAYYVSVVDGRRYALALGPFDTHAAALERVGPVRDYCNKQSDRAWFYGYGTCRLEPGDEHPPGKLNGAELERVGTP
jgi:hypothetical protein